MKHKEICIARYTFYDRAPFLKLSLDYQKLSENNDNFEMYVFVDPHPNYGYVSYYDHVIDQNYKRINWSNNLGGRAWYNSVYYIFENTNYEYVVTIEDDIIISKDYLKLCEQLALHDGALKKDDDILYFHIGAWEKPKGDMNLIIRSSNSIRSVLINRNKFYKYIVPYYEDRLKTEGLDIDLLEIMKINNLSTIAPQYNRHGHFGVYGWSSGGKHADNRGMYSIFKEKIRYDELYDLIKNICLDGQRLLELNNYKNPNYFWDFDPNANFSKLVYNI